MPEIAVVTSPALSGLPLTVHDKAFLQPVRDARTDALEATVAKLTALVGAFVEAQTPVAPIADTSAEPVVEVKEVVKPTSIAKPKAAEAKVEGAE